MMYGSLPVDSGRFLNFRETLNFQKMWAVDIMAAVFYRFCCPKSIQDGIKDQQHGGKP